MNIVYFMVGPTGCGKTTFRKDFLCLAVNLRVDSEAQEVHSKVSLTVKDEHIPAVNYALDMLTKRLERLK